MAFRILNEEEIALLTDSQRERYEKDLEIYLQRVAFVEQLELYENVTIQPYESRLETINIIDTIDTKEFIKPTYDMVTCNPVVKPELQVTKFEKLEQVEPMLPKFLKSIKVPGESIKKVEDIQLTALPTHKEMTPVKQFYKQEIEPKKLPVIAKLDIKIKSYKRSKEVKTNLSNVVKLIDGNSHDKQVNILNMDIPSMDISSVVNAKSVKDRDRKSVV